MGSLDVNAQCLHLDRCTLARLTQFRSRTERLGSIWVRCQVEFGAVSHTAGTVHFAGVPRVLYEFQDLLRISLLGILIKRLGRFNNLPLQLWVFVGRSVHQLRVFAFIQMPRIECTLSCRRMGYCSLRIVLCRLRNVLISWSSFENRLI